MRLSARRSNNILGWFVFFIAAYVFISTVAPTLSFWDCGEYIASSVKLEVGHAPGAATFQLLGAVIALFAFGDPAKYGLIINIESALCSAFAVLFMFWTVTHLARKLVLRVNASRKISEVSRAQNFVVFSSGLIGAFCFMFSDTFWFSAVEGEVYAMASMFTALIVWLICKWENDVTHSRSNKWLILISFLLGLSVGVHLMALLVIPTLGFIYFYKKYKLTLKSFFVTHLIILLLLGIYFKGLFPSLMYFFGYSEIFFINIVGLPFHSGTVIAFLSLVALFFFLIRFTHRNNYPLLNTITLCILYSFIGFSSWLTLPIRASANTPINLNNPDNAISMLGYYTRSVQYGDWPIFYGPMYTAYLDKEGIIGYDQEGSVYEKDEKSGKYIEVDRITSYKYNPDHVGFFPRMYHNSEDHIANYQTIAGKPEVYMELDPVTGKETLHYKKPSLGQNLYFFFDYQIGYMFLRYLLWNFAGRQNDLEGNCQITRGNWKSGISFVDELRLGPQDVLPQYLKNNKANNTYYFFPLILGLIGLFYQARNKFDDFYALLALFCLTGIGINIYTNMKPFEPRERDYAVVSAFYAYGIWIGLGVSALFHLLKRPSNFCLALSLSTFLMGIPLLMGYQNWNDHDRSHISDARDFARNYLDGCDPNAVLFVYGDNDTYPLWALQETENYRDDIRVLNYTLLGTAWYIDQARRKINNAPAIPMTLQHEQYRQGTRDAILIAPNEKAITVQEAMAWIARDDEKKETAKFEYLGDQKKLDFLPTNKLILPVDKEAVLKHKIVAPEDADKILPYILFEIPVKGGQAVYLYKNALMMLDMLANYKWDRPIYFSSGWGYNSANILYLTDYLQYTGFHYKLTPIRTLSHENGELGRIDTEELYRKVKKLHWANYKDPQGYFDANSRKNILTYRTVVSRTAEALIAQGAKQKAEELMDSVMKEIPQTFYEDNLPLVKISKNYIKIGKENKAMKIAYIYAKNALEEIDYYMSLPQDAQISIGREMKYIAYKYSYLISEISDAYAKIGQKDQTEKYVLEAYREISDRVDKLIVFSYNLQERSAYEEAWTMLLTAQNGILFTLKKYNPELGEKLHRQFLKSLKK
ncbi:MAG: DUF2723 domain-containing protein [Flavobacteriales bacterium Tduv]